MKIQKIRNDKGKLVNITNPYTLRRRFYDHKGQPLEWIDLGTGQWQGIEIVQRQIKLLLANYTNKVIEVEFMKDDKYLDFEGNETDKPIFYARRTR